MSTNQKQLSDLDRKLEVLINKIDNQEDSINKLIYRTNALERSATKQTTGADSTVISIGGNPLPAQVPLNLIDTNPDIHHVVTDTAYTAYDNLGIQEFGTETEWSQAKIYARRSSGGGSAADLRSDVVIEITPQSATTPESRFEIRADKEIHLTGDIVIDSDKSGGEMFWIKDNGTVRWTLERDGDITVNGDQNSGIGTIQWNANTGTSAFSEYTVIMGTNYQWVSLGTSVSGYNNGAVYMGDFNWLNSTLKDFHINSWGVTDIYEISFNTGTGQTDALLTKRAGINKSGLILENGTRIDEFSTDTGLSGDSDLAVPTEKAVKAYIDAAGGGYTDADAVDAIEAVGTATPIASDTVVFSDAGVLKRIVFSSLTHAILTGLGGKYTDANAVDAIEGVGLSTPGFSDWFIYSDGGVLKRAVFSSITGAMLSGLNHDSLTGFTSTEHFTMLDEDDLATNSNTQAATQQSIKAYVAAENHTRYANTEAVDAIEAVGTSTPIASDTVVFSDGGVLKRIIFSSLTHAILTGLGGKFTSANAVDAIEAVGLATPLNTDWIIFSDAGVLKKVLISGLNHSILSGLGGKYTDSQVDGIVATHTALPSAHHSKYTSANAVDAIEAVGTATPIASDTVVFSDGGNLKRIVFSGLNHSILSGLGGKYTDSSAIDAVEAVSLGTPVSTDWIIFSDAGVLKKVVISGLTHSILTGLGGKYTDGQVDTIVATHTALPSAHHSKYTSANAVDAIEAVGDSTPIASDTVIFSDGGILKKKIFSGLTHAILTGLGGKYTNANAVDAIEAVGTALPVNSDTVLFSDGGVLKRRSFSGLDHTILSGLGGKYTDSQVDTIVATHTALPSAHHTKYTGANAIDAIEGVATATPVATDTLIFNDAGTLKQKVLNSLTHGILTGLGGKYTNANAIDAIEGVSLATPGFSDWIIYNDGGTLKKAVFSGITGAMLSGLNHDSLTGFTTTEHFTMLDEDAMGSDSNTKAATQQSVKAYIDSAVAGISGIDGTYTVNTSAAQWQIQKNSTYPSYPNFSTATSNTRVFTLYAHQTVANNIYIDINSHVPLHADKTVTLTEIHVYCNDWGGGTGEIIKLYRKTIGNFSAAHSTSTIQNGFAGSTTKYGLTGLSYDLKTVELVVLMDWGTGWGATGGIQIVYTVV